MNSKPAILILKAQSVATREVEEVSWGIEEEGIPIEIRSVTPDVPVTELAKRAAQNSALNVGIGIDEKGEIVLHHRDLPVGMPLAAFLAGSTDRRRLRLLGTNAGRLAKGQPLVLDDKDQG